MNTEKFSTDFLHALEYIAKNPKEFEAILLDFESYSDKTTAFLNFEHSIHNYFLNETSKEESLEKYHSSPESIIFFILNKNFETENAISHIYEKQNQEEIEILKTLQLFKLKHSKTLNQKLNEAYMPHGIASFSSAFPKNQEFFYSFIERRDQEIFRIALNFNDGLTLQSDLLKALHQKFLNGQNNISIPHYINYLTAVKRLNRLIIALLNAEKDQAIKVKDQEELERIEKQLKEIYELLNEEND